MMFRTFGKLGLVGLLVFAVETVPAENPPFSDYERMLRAELEGKTVLVRGFYPGSELVFDPEGKYLGSELPESWTTSAELTITAIAFTERGLQIEGRRHFFVYDPKARKFREVLTDTPEHLKDRKQLLQQLRDKEAVRILVQTGPESDVERLRSALRQVLVLEGKSLADIVPDFWRPLLTGKRKPLPQFPGLRVAPGSGGLKPLQPAQPKGPKPPVGHSDELLIDGTTVLRVVVDAGGNVADVVIVRPVGLGLDEKAVEGVRTWRFEPARTNGAPVPVMVQVEVNFRLH